MENIVPQDPAQAFRVNRIAAAVMAFATAVSLLFLRPELSLVYAGYLAISVYLLTWIGTLGLFGRPRAIGEQNFAAYVAASTLLFGVTLAFVPQVIETVGVFIAIAVSALIAGVILRALLRQE